MKAPQKSPFLKRLYIYQKERFPVLGHGVLIAAFTFSAIAYSRICRDAEGFIPLKQYLTGVLVTVSLFFLVRIFDEFKDKEDDAQYRPYLPVPRGLISFKELNILAFLTIAFQILIILIFQPPMIWLYALVMAYLVLMRVEFFIPQWLKKRQIWYVASHMVIIPLVDLYASGLDWLLANAQPHIGLVFFFAVSYMNGVVLEFGRKIRAPHKEEEGVISYTTLFGTQKGAFYWLLILFITLLLAMAASAFAEYSWIAYSILLFFFLICALPGFLFLSNPTEKLSKWIEHASAAWTIAMYLTLGGAPMAGKLLL